MKKHILYVGYNSNEYDKRHNLDKIFAYAIKNRVLKNDHIFREESLVVDINNMLREKKLRESLDNQTLKQEDKRIKRKI